MGWPGHKSYSYFSGGTLSGWSMTYFSLYRDLGNGYAEAVETRVTAKAQGVKSTFKYTAKQYLLDTLWSGLTNEQRERIRISAVKDYEYYNQQRQKTLLSKRVFTIHVAGSNNIRKETFLVVHHDIDKPVIKISDLG